MSAPQFLLYQRGGTVFIDVPRLATAATVRIVDGDDGEQLPHMAVNVSTINTSLAAAAYSLNSQLTLASNTGMAVGRTFWIQDDPEEALCKSVAGGTVKLRRPLFYDHVNAARVEGSRMAVNIAANWCNALWWDGRCEWNIDGELFFTAVECCRYPLQRLASAQDLFDIEPKIADLVDAETDVERWLDNAHDLILGELAKRAQDERARVFPGTMEFKSVTAAAAMYLHYLRRPGAEEFRTTWWTEVERRLANVVSITPRDPNQDGQIDPDEKMSTRTVALRR